MPDRLLVAYASRYGTSRRIAERLAERARAAGHEVRVHDLGAGPTEPGDATRVVVVGAVYSNQHDGALIGFLQAHRAALAALRCGLVSVSLAAAIGDDEGEAMVIDYVDELSRLTGFAPKDVATIAGGLDETRYDAATRALLNVARWRTALGVQGDHSFVDDAQLDKLARRWFGAPAR